MRTLRLTQSADSRNIHKSCSHHTVDCWMTVTRKRMIRIIANEIHSNQRNYFFTYHIFKSRYHVAGSLRPGIISKMIVYIVVPIIKKPKYAK